MKKASSLTFQVQVIDNGDITAKATQVHQSSGGPSNAPYQQGIQTFSFLNQVAHLSKLVGLYDPSVSGALSSLTYSLDFETISGGNPNVGIGLLLRQGNNYYVADYHGVGQNGWNTGATTDVSSPAAYILVSGTRPMPDFSASGLPIQVGYLTAVSTQGSQALSVTTGAANFTVTVNGTTVTDGNMNDADWNFAILKSDNFGNATDSKTSSIGVTDAPLTLTLVPPSPTAGVAINSQTVATFTDPNPTATPSDFQACIYWGDGFVSNASSADGTLTSTGGGSFAISGSHTYLSKATNLTFTVLVLDTVYGGAPQTVTQQLSGGPANASYQQGTQSLSSAIQVAHLSKGAGYYDPSVSGALATLKFSFDFQTFSGPDANAKVGVGFLLRQGNNYYIANYTGYGPNGWNIGTTTTLSATDFLLESGTVAAPDFSASGAPMEFGYFIANSTRGSQPITTTFGIANFSVNRNDKVYTDSVFSDGDWVVALLKYDAMGNSSASKSAIINVS
jgi:hypothetical protein